MDLYLPRELVTLRVSSKLDAEWGFLTHLREIGRKVAGAWLDDA